MTSEFRSMKRRENERENSSFFGECYVAIKCRNSFALHIVSINSKTAKVMYKRTNLSLLNIFSRFSYVRIVSRLSYFILNIRRTQYIVIFYIPMYKTPGSKVMPALT